MNHKMKSPTSLLGNDDGEQVEELALTELIPFGNHPYRVEENQELAILMESIEKQGVTVPIIVRPKGRGIFEIVSGHRRSKASALLGLETIPAFIRDLDDDEAILAMVDTNIHRETLLFSEKAFAYRLKMEALKRKAGRPSKQPNQATEGESLDSETESETLEHQLTWDSMGFPPEQKTESGANSGKRLKTRELMAQHFGESGVQIQRFIRLTELLPTLLDLVDLKKIPFQTGVELSYLKKEEQELVLEFMTEQKMVPSLEQATKLKKYSRTEALTASVVEMVLEQRKEKPLKLSMKTDMRAFFPQNTSQKEMENVVLQLLKEWKEKEL